MTIDIQKLEDEMHLAYAVSYRIEIGTLSGMLFIVFLNRDNKTLKVRPLTDFLKTP